MSADGKLPNASAAASRTGCRGFSRKETSKSTGGSANDDDAVKASNRKLSSSTSSKNTPIDSAVRRPRELDQSQPQLGGAARAAASIFKSAAGANRHRPATAVACVARFGQRGRQGRQRFRRSDRPRIAVAQALGQVARWASSKSHGSNRRMCADRGQLALDVGVRIGL